MASRPAPDTERLIRAEQARLLMGNMGSSLLPAIAVALLLVHVLATPDNTLALRLWCAGVIVSKVFASWDARRLLRAPILPEHAGRLTRRLIVLNAIDGAAWGALAFAGLDPGSAANSILVVAVLAGIVGNSMSLLSPVLPVFAVFCVFELGALALKTWTLGDVAFQALSLAVLIYLTSLLSQGRNSSRAARAAIRLRFDNIELIDQLRVETNKAQQALHAAEQANLAKSKFLAAASHDLRQPIHAQGLFLEVLGRSALTPAQREVLASARSASEASASMLHTLLDFSRIEAGVVEAHIVPFRLQPLLAKIESELAPQANGQGLLYRTHDSELVLQSDPALVELILRNLVSNAVRYTERGGILVGCRRRGGGAVVEVWDTGIGIAAAQQQEIFQEFHQLGNPERDRQKGLGLGLSIARGLARILAAPLTLSSQPGRGSVFRLALPLATLDAPAAAVAAPPPAPLRPLAMRVLLVDDDAIVCASMQRLLQAWGCECQVADGIGQALALAPALRPELIISDYRLRGQQTGAEAIAALREQAGRALPALLITGDTAPARLREARNSGVPLLHKPVAPAQLYQVLVDIAANNAGDGDGERLERVKGIEPSS
ncbi:ATP-binding response regulator [Janthinobacterium sp. HH01]|uniref:ATP-binding response regulator n=1 Tax=Janthinobacterium sp. HH01 TaxID=1198452 RepID=UPI0006841512|nr:hybrid sensor histidine kinase/response regulator [Janthinobacterium sp. HH01]